MCHSDERTLAATTRSKTAHSPQRVCGPGWGRVGGFGKDSKHQDRTDARHLLQSLEVGVVLQMQCAALANMVSQCDFMS
jgi:hypothetical protein